MARQKKVTIKPFLNYRSPEKVKLVNEQTNETKTINQYPVYIQVTYNRKSTQFRSVLKNESFENEQQITTSQQLALSRQIEILEMLIQYELPDDPENYSLIGLSEKYNDYSKQIIDIIREEFIMHYKSVLMRLESEYKPLFHEIRDYAQFAVLLKATNKLIPEFRDKCSDREKLIFDTLDFLERFNYVFSSSLEVFPTKIEWLTGKAQNWFKEKLDLYFHDINGKKIHWSRQMEPDRIKVRDYENLDKHFKVIDNIIRK